jgi:pyruvate dehydrogenase E1 component beta subunit
LTKAAIRDPNPVVVLEPRVLYGRREDFEPSEDAVLPLGKGELLSEGDDVTFVVLGQMVGVALDTVSHAEGWTADVIDLRTLMPWDRGLVERSVAKTGRLVIVEENQLTGGWGAGIAAHVASKFYSELRGPVVRITAPDVHVPYSTELEARFIPSAPYVARQVQTLISTGRAPQPWWEGEL